MASITGTVKWYNSEKGYGFISCNNGNDVFVHHSQIKSNGPEKDLAEGESVSFDVQDGAKGPMATNVHRL
ncbi:cold-shock protein [Inconstantimicrobium mannanitabidum]|uniref:Cold-shock protein n=1 Tax=Inconstantimicrobium mannanitabidum TaxID=1604901 RepID=A0ACB5RE09_9CLOT|nr:cold shock domain-containing protein [Clostridium sp. TW13]GKX67331.1 cold-shock protein [Clostridium sp. TW13]